LIATVAETVSDSETVGRVIELQIFSCLQFRKLSELDAKKRAPVRCGRRVSSSASSPRARGPARPCTFPVSNEIDECGASVHRCSFWICASNSIEETENCEIVHSERFTERCSFGSSVLVDIDSESDCSCKNCAWDEVSAQLQIDTRATKTETLGMDSISVPKVREVLKDFIND
jgi:hypothetical protein